MKKQHFKRIYGIILGLLSLTANAAAYDFEVDGIGYTITSFTDFTATATAATENATSSLTIPSSVSFNGKELTVTEIGEGFAKDNTIITDVVAEQGITTINNNAFQGCSNLEGGIQLSVGLRQEKQRLLFEASWMGFQLPCGPK